MNLFELLRQHARIEPDAMAVSSTYRSMTYRKLWSRIERATARLQGEWGIKSGDVVAYCGQAHPDAIVLYVALARCAARLIPLEHRALQSRIGQVVRALDVRIVVHDDHTPVEKADLPAAFKPLSALIMTRCHYQPSIIAEDAARPSLVAIRSLANGHVQSEQKSLDRMIVRTSAAPDRIYPIAGSLFDDDVFAPVVLQALLAGGTLIFH
jgi:acyl-CoA synthetase (AMP-forming)/AMP-acid ligase II